MDKGTAFDLYQDIAERTDGDVYIGVVGPCRTGKSTFISRFMTARAATDSPMNCLRAAQAVRL